MLSCWPGRKAPKRKITATGEARTLPLPSHHPVAFAAEGVPEVSASLLACTCRVFSRAAPCITFKISRKPSRLELSARPSDINARQPIPSYPLLLRRLYPLPSYPIPSYHAPSSSASHPNHYYLVSFSIPSPSYPILHHSPFPSAFHPILYGLASSTLPFPYLLVSCPLSVLLPSPPPCSSRDQAPPHALMCFDDKL
ncbi:hypothetical protein E2C01_061393 [Portunus trituberculatus]|uniref:Uncharacterized protein n=1 Tax=Portunus trituberculatus TaxID=210409 RepID=A0A5B7HEX4_PORTR|nr:hypothetical protein [Portunus trituberculatus]